MTSSGPLDGAERLGTVAEMHSAEGLFVADEQQRIVHWSELAERMLGYRAEDVVGRPCYEVMAGARPDGHPICRPLCRVVLNARRGRVTRHFEVITHNSAGEPVEARNNIVLFEAGLDRQPWMLHLFNGTPVKLPIGRAVAANARSSPEVPIPGQLSRREFEVLRLLAAGLTKEQVAAELGIATVTARNHISALERKLGAHNQLEVVRLAVHHHLL